MQEVASIASESDAAATARVLRVESTRSCEDMLLELVGEVHILLFYAIPPRCNLAVPIPYPFVLRSSLHWLLLIWIGGSCQFETFHLKD